MKEDLANNIRNEILNTSCNCNLHKAYKLLEVVIKDDDLLKKVNSIVFDMWFTMCNEFEETEMQLSKLQENLKESN